VRLAPGIPRALFSKRAERHWQNSRETSGEIVKLCLGVTAKSEADEAIHSYFPCCGIDCFASFAMTALKLKRVSTSPRLRGAVRKQAPLLRGRS
jgi:hypothetical protein